MFFGEKFVSGNCVHYKTEYFNWIVLLNELKVWKVVLMDIGGFGLGNGGVYSK